MPVISIQGEPESYSYKTVVKRFGQSFVIRYRRSFRETFNDVKNGESDFALLPFINYITSEIPENYTLLFEYQFPIHEAITTKLDHALLGKPGLTLDKIKYIYSHQQALAQCTDFTGQEQFSGVAIKEVHDTAGAKLYLEQNPEISAIIASKSSAKALGLQVISYPIQNDKRNKTTFFLLSAKSRRLTESDNMVVVGLPTAIEGDALMLFAVFEGSFSVIRIYPEGLPYPVAKTYFLIKLKGDLAERKKVYSLLKKENLFTYMSGVFGGTL
ncbi:MAG: hypothetical protein IT279_03725 [Ignavibacteriaceae bacterium]|nr:hypothetical protein [Ignavibacteriaceae bacterium]